MMQDHIPMQPVKLSQTVDYRCTCCGACCRQVENAVMLESLDAFRLAQYFRKVGNPIQTMEGILTTYTEPKLLAGLNYPIFLLKTAGPEQACVFLKDNRCTIQPAKPRVCRLYPFSVSEAHGKKFSYVLSREKPHHFSDGRLSVNDWFHENFNKEDRDFVRAEFELATKLGRALRALRGRSRDEVLSVVLFFKYFNFSLDEPFLPQYHRNNAHLLRMLLEQIHAQGGE